MLSRLSDATESQKERLRVRIECAKNWLRDYAPEDFKFALQTENDEKYAATDTELAAIREFSEFVEKYLDDMTEKEFSNYIYQAAQDNGMESADFFRLIYTVLINKEKGPKLAGFLKACGSETILPILKRY